MSWHLVSEGLLPIVDLKLSLRLVVVEQYQRMATIGILESGISHTRLR